MSRWQSEGTGWPDGQDLKTAIEAGQVNGSHAPRFIPNKSPNPKPRLKYKSSKTTRTKLYEAQGGRCYYCGKAVQLAAFSTDHIIPKCRGGQKGSNNTVGACKSCNNAKGNMTLTEFLETDYLPNERRALLGFPDEPVVEFQEARDGHGKRIGDYWSKLLKP